MLAVSDPLRGPFRYALVPQATQADGLCALGLWQVKAIGLVQVVDLLVRYCISPKKSSIFICSRGYNIYRNFSRMLKKELREPSDSRNLFLNKEQKMLSCG